MAYPSQVTILDEVEEELSIHASCVIDPLYSFTEKEDNCGVHRQLQYQENNTLVSNTSSQTADVEVFTDYRKTTLSHE